MSRIPALSHRWFILLSVAVFGAFPFTTVGAAETPRRTDLHGDPLPDGAMARLGSMRWRHPRNVTFITYINDGKELVTSCGDGIVHVWNAETGKEVRRIDASQSIKQLPGRPRVVTSIGFGSFLVAVTSDGKTLATAGTDGKVHLWDIATGTEDKRSFIHDHPQSVSGLTFTPDGKTVITRGMQDGKIKLWETATGKLAKDFSDGSGNQRAVFYVGATNNISVSPDGKLLAGSVLDPTNPAGANLVRIWNLADGKELRSINETGPANYGVSNAPRFSPDGKSLAWIGVSGKIHLHDVATGKESVKLEGENEYQFQSAIFYDASKALAALTMDNALVLYDVRTGKKIKVIGADTSGAEKPTPAAVRFNYYYNQGALSLSPDGKTIAQSAGPLVRQSNLETGKSSDTSAGHRGAVQGVMVAPDGKTAVTVGADHTVRKWDLTTGKELHKSDLPRDMFTPLLKTASCLIYRDPEGAIRVWDTMTGKELHKWSEPGNIGNLHEVSFDGKFAAFTTANQSVHVYSTVTGKEVREIKGVGNGGLGGSFTGLDINRDGSGVAVQLQTFGAVPNNITSIVRMYSVESGKVMWEAPVPASCSWFNFSNDGHSLAIIHTDGTTTLLDAATGKERGRYDTTGTCLMFSEDGHFMAVATVDGQVKLYDAWAGKEIAHFDGSQGRVSWIAFTPNAEALLSGGADGTTVVWDTREVVRKARSIKEVDADLAKKLWSDLGEENAGKASHAIAALIASPKQALTLTGELLKPAKRMDISKVNKWITDLDNDDFTVRQKAFDELARVGGQAIPAMKKALENDPPLELRVRLEQLLDRAAPGSGSLTPDVLREVRAIEVLELLGTPEAKSALESVAGGAPGMRVTAEAAAALKRMANQPRP